MSTPIVVLATPEIQRNLLQNLARPQSRVVIVTPFLQDVDMGASGTLRALIERQVLANAEIELFTTAPQLSAGGELRRKFTLLQTFSGLGVRIFVNPRLHAKAFCFNREDATFMTLLGSANLTSHGLFRNMELAVLSGRDAVYHSVMANVRIYLRDRETLDFLVWVRQNAQTLTTLLGRTV